VCQLSIKDHDDDDYRRTDRHQLADTIVASNLRSMKNDSLQLTTAKRHQKKTAMIRWHYIVQNGHSGEVYCLSNISPFIILAVFNEWFVWFLYGLETFTSVGLNRPYRIAFSYRTL